MTLGAGIAVAGIWLGVGIVGWRAAVVAVPVAFFAWLATLAVAG